MCSWSEFAFNLWVCVSSKDGPHYGWTSEGRSGGSGASAEKHQDGARLQEEWQFYREGLWYDDVWNLRDPSREI